MDQPGGHFARVKLDTERLWKLKMLEHMEAERPLGCQGLWSGVNGETLVKEYTVSVMQDE